MGPYGADKWKGHWGSVVQLEDTFPISLFAYRELEFSLASKTSGNRKFRFQNCILKRLVTSEALCIEGYACFTESAD